MDLLSALIGILIGLFLIFLVVLGAIDVTNLYSGGSIKKVTDLRTGKVEFRRGVDIY